MKRCDALEIELVEHSPGAPLTGIGRYTRELFSHLAPRVSVRLTTHVDPPLTPYLPFLHHFPVGVSGHKAGSIVHFVEDMGCSQMLWRSIHPSIATSHDLGMLVWLPEAKMHRTLDRIILRLSYLGLRRMDAVITVSEFSRQTLIHRLNIPAERVFTVYSGNDNELFRPMQGARIALETRYGLPDSTNAINLLYVGTEIPRKNLATVLQALKRLPSNVRLLKVGASGGDRFRKNTQRQIATLELDQRVFFFGKVPEEDLPLFYNAADAYVCASYLEGFGHPILEAMACGVPVVCSNNTSLPEITNGAAILAHPDDSHSLAEAVMSISGDRALRERMATCGRQQAAKFSWERTAEGVTAVYHQVANHTAEQR